MIGARSTAIPVIVSDDASNSEEHGFVINKTQEYLKSKGFGWLMEVDRSTESKENLLGGESVQQPSILEELDIDANEIISKVKKVIVPLGTLNPDELSKFKEPDFWGPFFIIFAYSVLVELAYLQLRVITWMYLIWFIGSALLWMLARLFTPSSVEEAQSLSKKENNDYAPVSTTDDDFPITNEQTSNNSAPQIVEVQYGQVLSFVGYSLIPHLLILLVVPVMKFIFSKGLFYYTNLLLNLGAIGWSTYSCLYLLTTDNYYLDKKKKLLIVPILLLHLYFFSMQSGV